MIRSGTSDRRDARLAWMLIAPAMALLVFAALGPIAATGWEALHGHDLRLPWLGRPFIGLSNFSEAAGDPRFRDAVSHTILFALVSVPIELALGLALALIMHRAIRGRALIRVTALLPWTIPTVVAALIWRFMFDAQSGVGQRSAARRRHYQLVVRLVRPPRRRVDPHHRRRCLEDDSVCGDHHAGRPADHRPQSG